MSRKAYFQITVGGLDISKTISPILISLSVTDKTGSSSDSSEIEIDDTDGRVIMPRPGQEMAVRLGWEGGVIDEVFKGKVEGIRSRGSRGNGRTLSISAKGVDTKGKAKQPQSRHMDNMTVQQAMQKAGEEAGVTNIRVAPALASIMRPYWSMDAESFLHFGERIAREIGGTFKVRGDQAVLAERGAGTSASGLVLPTVIARWGDNLMDWDISPVLGKPQYQEVRGRYYDRREAKWKEVRVQVPNTDATATLTRRNVAADRSEATNSARNDAQDSKDKKGEGSVTLEGEVSAKPEGSCVVVGAREGIDGLYKIDGVEHNYSRSGFTTKLTLKQPDDNKTGQDSRRQGGSSGSGSSSTGAPTSAPTPAARPTDIDNGSPDE